MADIQCVNPACQRTNPDTKVFCVHCGWRLPKAEAPPPPENLADLQAENLQLKQQNARLLADSHTQQQQLTQATDAHQQLQAQHNELTSAHQDLTQQHQQTGASLSAAQEQLADAVAAKQAAEAAVANLQEQLKTASQPGAASPQAQAKIAELGGLLAAAQKELAVAVAKIKAFEASPVGKDTWPIRKRIISWALAGVVGLGGGTALGVFSPLGPSKQQAATKENDDAQQKQNLAALQAQLTKATQDLNKSNQDTATLQQSNAQLSTQIETLSKQSQNASKQSTTAQAQATEAKADIVKEHAATIEAQQALQAERARNQQLTERAAKVASLEATIAAHPSLSYKGPTQGTITIKFNGKNDKPASIIMDHFNTSFDSSVKVDSVSGMQMPGVPVLVEPMTKNVSIAAPPSTANGWQRMTLYVQGKGSNQAVLKWSVF